jgi:UDP-glucuronate 4-epimerase
MRRDFTYIDDVSQAVVRLIDRPPQCRHGAPVDPSTSSAPWKVYNVGNNRPEDLMDVVRLLEKEFGRTAIKEMLPMQPGDVEATYADIAELESDIGFRPSTTIDQGVARFAKWFCEYHSV